MCDELLPLISALASDASAEVRLAAGGALVGVAPLFAREELGARVLTVVLALAHDDDAEELRMSAAVLLNELSDAMGPELCAQFVLPEMVCLAEDPVFRVRKAAALNLDAVCRAAGPALAQRRLLPAFLRLAADDIWGVRKAAAESLVAVSRSLEPAARCAELVPAFERLVADASKWVRAAALGHVAPFLATLPSARISPALLAHLTHIGVAGEAPPPPPPPAGAAAAAPAAPTSGAGAVAAIAVLGLTARSGADPTEVDLAAHAAFSFPAVALALGRARWPELRALFWSLSRDAQRRVRRPLACALHEIARIVGPEAAEADLSPALDVFLRDCEDVRSGALRGLSAFLGALSAEAREGFAPVLPTLVNVSAPNAWRARRLLASQLGAFAALFCIETVADVLAPMTLSLTRDSVAAVRAEARSGLSALLERLEAAAPEAAASLVADLVADATASTFQRRLNFAQSAEALAAGEAAAAVSAAARAARSSSTASTESSVSSAGSSALFHAEVVPRLLALSRDPVRNVRAAVAKALAPYVPAFVKVLGRVFARDPTGATGAIDADFLGLEMDALPPWARAALGVGAALIPSPGGLFDALLHLEGDTDCIVKLSMGSDLTQWVSEYRKQAR